MAKGNPLRFNVTAKTANGATYYEAVANIPGFSNTNVTKIEDGTSRFNTRSSITVACNNRALSLGMTPVIRYSDSTSTTPTTAVSVTGTQTKNRRKARASKR